MKGTFLCVGTESGSAGRLLVQIHVMGIHLIAVPM